MNEFIGLVVTEACTSDKGEFDYEKEDLYGPFFVGLALIGRETYEALASHFDNESISIAAPSILDVQINLAAQSVTMIAISGNEDARLPYIYVSLNIFLFSKEVLTRAFEELSVIEITDIPELFADDGILLPTPLTEIQYTDLTAKYEFIDEAWGVARVNNLPIQTQSIQVSAA